MPNVITYQSFIYKGFGIGLKAKNQLVQIINQEHELSRDYYWDQ
jgi:hypothetical protein